MSAHDRRRRRWRAPATLGGLVLAVALILAVLLSASATRTRTPTTPPTTTMPWAPARPAPRVEQFGASVNWLFNSASPPSLIATQLQALRDTGVTIARTDALWEASEPRPPAGGVPSFDWSFDDTIAGDLAAHGLRWLPILDYSAPWAESVAGQDHSPPDSSAAYAAYAGAFAARYGPGGTFWQAHPELRAQPVQTYEIWNEPDNGQFWAPAPDAARYAELYTSARQAIDGADPTARVIVGGLTHPTVFLPAMLAAVPALRGHIDGVAVHPYGPPSVVLAKIKAARAALAGLGMTDVPLYVTEFGWTTTPPGALNYLPSGRRAGDISDTMAALGHLDCGLAATVLYTWYTPMRDPSDSQQWFGIDSLTGAPDADTAAFARGLQRARAAGGTLALCR